MNYMILLALLNIYLPIIHGDSCSMSQQERIMCGPKNIKREACIKRNCCWKVNTKERNYINCAKKLKDNAKPLVTTQSTSATATPNGKKVYAHLRPWFETNATSPDHKWGYHWTMVNFNPDQIVNGKRKIASYFYPLIDLYASGDKNVIDWQLGLMKLSGINVVLIDWTGTANTQDYPSLLRNCEAIISRTQLNGLEFAIIYSDQTSVTAYQAGLTTDILAQGKLDLLYLQNNYFNMMNYAKINGLPLLLDFGPQTIVNASQWTQLFSVFTIKPCFLTLWNQMNQAGDNAKGEFAWIWPNFLDGLEDFYKHRNISLMMGVAYPGFDTAYDEGGWGGPDWLLNVTIDNFGKTLELALKYTDHVQIGTWNDYSEGTMIEPTQEFQYGFLTLLQSKLKSKHTQKELEKLTLIYKNKNANLNNATWLLSLEADHFKLVNS